MNDENLIPTTELTESERRELARKGGIASGEARRKRKQMRDDLRAMLDSEQKFSDGKTRRVQEGIVHKLVTAAMSGDLRAIEQIAKLMGEYEQRIKVDGTINTPQIIVQDKDTAEALATIFKTNDE